MSAKPIREFDGKHLLSHFLQKESAVFTSSAQLCSLRFDLSLLEDSQKHFDEHVRSLLNQAEREHPWLKETKLVCKPDQLIKRRGKNGLLGINLNWSQVREWITKRAGTVIQIERTRGILDTFLVEPFCPHPQDTEFYICIQSVRQGDLIFFTHEGGVDVGDVDAKATRLMVEVNKPFPTAQDIQKKLLKDVPSESARKTLVEFVTALHRVYVKLNFTYLEINPLVVLENQGRTSVHYLDLAAKLDQTADFECGGLWAKGRASAYPDCKDIGGPAMEFPAPFGRQMTKEEAYIAELDAKTGASLKLTVLNPHGRIWTMVAGGGASVCYADAIGAYGYADELANYGEYSGAPSESQTYEYAKTILDLMTRGNAHPEGKILFIGGGIANFTNVAATFKGIIRALKEFQKPLQSHKVKIFVRRAGPNYQEGLRLMRSLGESLGVEINVFGPEMHVTGIVPLALKGDFKGLTPVTTEANGNSLMDLMESPGTVVTPSTRPASPRKRGSSPTRASSPTRVTAKNQSGFKPPFSKFTRAFIYGMQPRAVQGMLDFDFMCKREKPSVACMIYPFGGHHVQKFYWGTKETLIPVYNSVEEACRRFPEVDVVVNFASFRSVYQSTKELMTFSQIKTIAIIAEGVPENRARELLWEAKSKNILIIGPATVGGITPGAFKIGNTGGMMDNIVSSKLYRPGSVAYVSKSGGMSNELNNIISRATDGVYEGIAIGGDRYPGSTFIDHILRFQADDNAKIIVLLGEVGGVEEYEIAKAVQSGKITKPVVAWCIGTCATMFTTDVQFGHAGSFANSDLETARAKNQALKDAGVHVPETFEDFPNVLKNVYEKLVKDGTLVPRREPQVPKIPIDYAWAQELGLVRKPASFISTICDDRGQELNYAGMAISEIFKEDIGIGGVLSLLWFKRRLPSYATKFIEMVLMLTADHGPAVSGAHNTIVTARAGKDLISSLVSGLLTIGERFGGALDGAAQSFSAAFDKGLSPAEFVSSMRKANKLILGIGHKIKSRTNPDLRVSIVKEFVINNFPNCDILKYALEVEKITTAKKDNLILNVDGAVGVAFVDLLRGCGAFSREEAEEYIQIGTLNGLFVLGRSIGFIGHYLDQKRLKQGLYRHPWDDISYMMPEEQDDHPTRTLADASEVTKRGVAINADMMFTYIGPTLVAVNPYKKLPYFTEKEIEMYNGSAAYEHPPHIYAVADRMYLLFTRFHNMITDEENQCVIISGESGAGKTESAKLIMNYVSDISGKGGAATAQVVEAVKNIILESNPLLESFGNAKTLRNNNSSRFGKYFEINFTKSGSPAGGKISNFLLEKSRVVGPGKGERNFHVFYQMTKGITGELKEQLGMTEPSYFHYLKMSGEYNADGIDDIQEFQDMSRAMDICQISDQDKQSIFRITCGILHLGNIDFVEGEDGNKAVLRNRDTLAFPAYLLGISEDLLEQKLLSRVINTGFGKRGSSYNVPLNVEQAKGTRDALSKAMYTRMFDWIVQAVNNAMSRLAANLREGQILCLGVLDIFGFEIFEKNGFEQFCINYVNEKLQQIFIELTLKSEQEEYQREGIQWTQIEYFNNQVVVDLIESKKPPGIMAILDDVCNTMHAVSDGADATFLQKLGGAVGNHKHFKGNQAQFIVQHYAGSVTYDSDGFTEANKDTLYKDLIQLVQSTTDHFLLNLFPDVIDEGDKKRPTTVSFKIKCTPSYVRCIKPNESKKPKDWDQKRVEHQVRYLNLKENIKVRRAGFCYRNTFDKFLRRFAILTQETFPRWNGKPQDGITLIMESVTMDPKEWQLGTQKVFIKSPESLFLLEESRDRKYHTFAKVIQRAYRRWKSRKYFLEMRKKAADIMHNKKERKRFSINREFLGDYLNVLDNAVLKALIGNKNERTLFSDVITKYDRTFKTTQREFLITDQHVFIIGAEKVKDGPNKGQYIKIVKRKIPFADITGVSVSTKCDDILVVHVNNDYDNVLENIFKTELISVLNENYQKTTGRPLPVNFTDTISYTVKKTRWQGGGNCELRFSSEPSIKAMVFKNNGKVTEIKTPVGLPKDSRPNNKSLFESSRPKATGAAKSAYSGQQSQPPVQQTSYQSQPDLGSQVQNMKISQNNLNSSQNPLGATTSNAASTSSLSTAAAAKKKPPPAPPKKNVPKCTALYNYDATEADELTLKVGDVIIITSKDDAGWWTGTLNGKTGLFPSNYVQEN